LCLDWSYELLPETEQIILRRVAVFQGDFTINAAAAVATDERIGAADVFEAIANVAAKSLISTDISSDVTYHRLPPPEDPGHHRDLYKLSLTVPRF
jgi:predicted ATPase